MDQGEGAETGEQPVGVSGQCSSTSSDIESQSVGVDKPLNFYIIIIKYNQSS